jgi:hypothetical protein
MLERVRLVLDADEKVGGRQVEALYAALKGRHGQARSVRAVAEEARGGVRWRTNGECERVRRLSRCNGWRGLGDLLSSGENRSLWRGTTLRVTLWGKSRQPAVMLRCWVWPMHGKQGRLVSCRLRGRTKERTMMK